MGKGLKKEIEYKVAEGTDVEKRNVVYSIENTITGNKYAGLTTRMLKQRLSAHFGCHSKSKYSTPSRRTIMYEDIDKYGANNFTVSILFEDDDILKLKAFEKDLQRQDDYQLYSSRDVNRSRGVNRIYNKIVCTSDDGEVLEFDTQADCSRHFNCDGSNISHALNTNYKLKRKYTLTLK